jgi:hypothetical protein
MTDIQRYAAFTADPAGGNPAGIVLNASGALHPVIALSTRAALARLDYDFDALKAARRCR